MEQLPKTLIVCHGFVENGLQVPAFTLKQGEKLVLDWGVYQTDERYLKIKDELLGLIPSKWLVTYGKVYFCQSLRFYYKIFGSRKLAEILFMPFTAKMLDRFPDIFFIKLIMSDEKNMEYVVTRDFRAWLNKIPELQGIHPLAYSGDHWTLTSFNQCIEEAEILIFNALQHNYAKLSYGQFSSKHPIAILEFRFKADFIRKYETPNDILILKVIDLSAQQ